MFPLAHPERLWLLAPLGVLAAWLARGARRRRLDWSSLGQSGRPMIDGRWGWWIATVLVVLALAQPRWGRMLGADPPPGHDVVLLVDVSRSMAAEDAVPDRLGVAIESGSSLLKALGAGEGNRAGVVAFAGRGVVRCPLTSHLDSALDALRGLRPGDVEPGGTDLGAAIDQAIGAFDEEDHAEGRTIVVFSDGEDHAGTWASEIERLRLGGIMVHAVAIGDPDRGYPLSSRDPVGTEVETRRSDVAFRAISQATGGALIPLGRASADLGAVFRDRIEPTARSRRDAIRIPERVERFSSLLLTAILCGLAASWPGLARRRGRRFAYTTLALAGMASGAGPPSGTASGLVARGQRAYDLGRFAEALEAFERAIAIEPDAAIPRYDAASALYQLDRHPEAIRRYEEARSRGDAGLSIKVDYALGNAHLALGDIGEALDRYEACLASTLEGAALDAVRRDAAANRDFAALRRKPPPESPGSGGPSPPGSDRKRPPPGPSNRDGGKSNPEPKPDSRPGEGEKAAGGADSSGRRGAGGAGGGGQAPESVGTPENRLDSALREIREARGRRPPDPPPPGGKGIGKDW